MGAFDKLKIDKAIAPVADTAKAVNALADILASIAGQNGVKVTVSEGRILIELDKNTGGTALSGGNSGSDVDSTIATELHYNAGGIQIDISGSYGIQISYGGNTFSINPTTFDITVTYSGTNLVIQGSAVTHSMSVREIDVCDSGVAKKMLVLGSAPY